MIVVLIATAYVMLLLPVVAAQTHAKVKDMNAVKRLYADLELIAEYVRMEYVVQIISASVSLIAPEDLAILMDVERRARQDVQLLMYVIIERVSVLIQVLLQNLLQCLLFLLLLLLLPIPAHRAVLLTALPSLIARYEIGINFLKE